MRILLTSLLVLAACNNTDLPATATDGGSLSGADSAMATPTPDAAAGDDTKPPKAGTDLDAKGNAGGDLDGGKKPLPDAMKMTGDEGAGTPVTSRSTPGVGSCARRTLADVIAAVHQLNPALADITILEGMDPNLSGDGNRIFAFAHDKGFRLVFKRGAGDCPAGCIDNRYWYFATDESCNVVAMGSYSRTFSSQGNCFTVEGTPLWGIPQPLDPAHQCGADNRPQNIAGTYRFRAAGLRQPCSQKGGNEEKVTLELTVVLGQTPADLSKGTVTIQGTGNPRLDGVSLPATFSRRRLAVRHKTSNLPAMCIDETETMLDLDLEVTPAGGKLSFFEVRAEMCPPSQDYCKGLMTLDLTAAK